MSLNNKEHLEAMARLVDELVHDYNNMMAIIIGFSDLLSTQTNDNKIKQYVEPISSTSERAIQLSNNLLAFSRRNFKYTEIIQPGDYLNQITPEVKLILSKDINFAIHVEKEAGYVKVDPDDFKAAILNMARNSNEAMSDDGEFSIRVCDGSLNGDRADAMEVQEGDYVVLEISDNGKGMSVETQARMFDPMYGTRHEKGLGMGLSQVYGFMQRAKGAIDCVSDVGEGCLFRIYLPKYYE